MSITPDPAQHVNAFRCAWVLLDEASQALLRAESIVVLLGSQCDGSAHHAYAVDVACELLRVLKEKLSQAQQLVQPGRRRSAQE